MREREKERERESTREKESDAIRESSVRGFLVSSGFGFQVSGVGLRVLGFGVQGFRDSGFGIPGSGCHVSTRGRTISAAVILRSSL